MTDAPVPARFTAPLPATADEAASGAIPEDVAGYYQALVGYAPTDVACAWLRDLATGTRARPVRLWAWTSLAECRGAEMTEVFARADAPDDPVIEFYFDRYDDERVPYTKRLVDAAAAIARTGDDYSVRRIGFAFAITGDPRAIEARPPAPTSSARASPCAPTASTR